MKLSEIFTITRYDQKMYIYVTNAYDQNVCLGRGTRYDIICDTENCDDILPHMLDEVDMISVTPDGGLQVLVRDMKSKMRTSNIIGAILATMIFSRHSPSNRGCTTIAQMCRS